MSRKSRRGKKRSTTPWIILALVVVTAVVGYYIFTQSGVGNGSPLDGQPVSPAGVTIRMWWLAAGKAGCVGSSATVSHTGVSIKVSWAAMPVRGGWARCALRVAKPCMRTRASR